MADSKITDLTAHTAIIGTDVLPIVDITAVVTKKTTFTTLLDTIRKGLTRVLSATSYTTDTGTSLNMDNLDQFIVTAQAGALLFNAPGGTKYDGQNLIIAVTGTASRALTWNPVFEASTVPLPSSTSGTARLNIGFKYRSDTSKWVCLAVS